MSASGHKRRALIWIGLVVMALLAGAWGVLALIHPHAAWLPGVWPTADLPPVFDVAFLLVPVIVFGVALHEIGVALELDWLAWRTRRARRR